MLKSKLLEVLGGFSARERSKFREYVFSPYFNKNKKVRSLCIYILQFAPHFDHPKLAKRMVYTNVFKQEGFEELKINNIISDLLQLLYDFLGQQQYKLRKADQKNYLLAELLDREIHHHVERNTKRYRQIMEDSPYQNFEHYFDWYNLYDKQDQYSLTQGRRGHDENLQLKSNMLDLYFFCNKLRIACDMTSRNIVVNAGYECHFLEELLLQYENNNQNFQAIPALKIYYKVLQMLRDDGTKAHYYELKELLVNHLPLFPQQELRILYNYALNYCVKQINHGQNLFYKEILDLYKVLLEQKIIFKNGHLTQWSYINIIASGIRLKEYDWTEQFIHEYKNYLIPEEQHNVYTYNVAAFHFSKSDYQRALRELHNVEFTDAFYQMAAKMIQLQSYYELDETEAFFALIEASKKYITRNRQISDYQKQSYGNFLKLAYRIYNLNLKRKQMTKTQLAAQKIQLEGSLQNPAPLANKNWLEEVLERI